MAEKDFLMSWLNDAYAMENAIVRILQNHVNDAKDYPQIQAKLREHLELTRTHADRVQGCVERLGGSVSGAKTVLGNILGTVQAVSTGPFEDELVKNTIADFAVEHFEIASYRSLISAAERVGDEETVRVCQGILREEVEMAGWLEQQLPTITGEVMRKKAERKAA